MGVTPTTWWSAGSRFGFPMELTELALDLAANLPNSAGLERCFSKLRLTYGMLRTKPVPVFFLHGFDCGSVGSEQSPQVGFSC